MENRNRHIPVASKNTECENHRRIVKKGEDSCRGTNIGSVPGSDVALDIHSMRTLPSDSFVARYTEEIYSATLHPDNST